MPETGKSAVHFMTVALLASSSALFVQCQQSEASRTAGHAEIWLEKLDRELGEPVTFTAKKIATKEGNLGILVGNPISVPIPDRRRVALHTAWAWHAVVKADQGKLDLVGSLTTDTLRRTLELRQRGYAHEESRPADFGEEISSFVPLKWVDWNTVEARFAGEFIEVRTNVEVTSPDLTKYHEPFPVTAQYEPSNPEVSQELRTAVYATVPSFDAERAETKKALEALWPRIRHLDIAAARSQVLSLRSPDRIVEFLGVHVYLSSFVYVAAILALLALGSYWLTLRSFQPAPNQDFRHLFWNPGNLDALPAVIASVLIVVSAVVAIYLA